EGLDRRARIVPAVARQDAGVGGQDAPLERDAEVAAGPDVRAEPAAAETVDGDEAPVREAAPVAARPTVDPGAEAEAAVAVVAGVVADGAPADVPRAPVPVDPGGGEDAARHPAPAGGGEVVPGAVVVGHPAPGLGGDPGQAGGGVGPAADGVGTPAGGDARPPDPLPFDRGPRAVARERRRPVAQVLVDVAVDVGIGLAAQVVGPALESVGSGRGAEHDPRALGADDLGRLARLDDRRSAVGRGLRGAAADDDLAPVVALPGDPVEADFLEVKDGVRGLDLGKVGVAVDVLGVDPDLSLDHAEARGADVVVF